MRAFVLGVMVLVAVAAWAGETSIVLREYLNQGWTREGVTYSFTAKAGECQRDSVTLTGPKGPLAVQLSDVELWPKTAFVKSAKVSFITDLAPLATDTYTLRYGKTAERNNIRSLISDLSVSRSPALTGDIVSVTEKPLNAVQLFTGQFGVQLLEGERHYKDPFAPEKVPGPVQKMMLGETPFGGSALFGTKKVTGFSGKLTAAGPVFAEGVITYTYEDASTLTITARLWAGDAQIQWATKSSVDAPKDGWELTVAKAGEALRLPWTGEFGGNKWGKLNEKVEVALEKEPVGDLTCLTPWNDWWNGCSQTTWTFNNAAGQAVLKAASLDAGCWVEPQAPGTLRNWEGWAHKLLPLRKVVSGDIVLHVDNAAGERKWAFGGAQPGVGHTLDTVKDYVLDWPGDAGTHPHMFLNAREMAAARAAQQPVDPALLQWLKTYWTGGLYKSGDGYIPSYHDTMALGAYLLTNDPQVAKDAKVLERFRNDMQIQGKFDIMRYTCCVTEYYDTLIDDPITPEAERGSLRALFAYLGYKLADPATWSCERGYRSYNLNMSVANVLNLGMVAAAIPTHPKAKEWAAPALAMTDAILNEVGPAGEFPESVTNYAGVTTSALLAFAIVAKNAGFHDYVNDPRMKRLLLWHTKEYTPIDPRSGGERAAGYRGLPPHGRAGAGHRDSLAGVMARATRDSDPAYAKALQWSWLQEGAPTTYHDSRMGGLEYLYLDKTLPAEKPQWGSEVYPLASVMFRNGLGTKDEHQINLVCGDFSHAVFPGEGGAFAGIWSYGVPIITSFAGGYAERDELLMSRVCIARGIGTVEDRKKLIGYCGFPYNLDESSTGKRVVKEQGEFGGKDGIISVSAFSTLARQDYAAVDVLMRYGRGGAWEPVADLPAWPPAPIGKAPVDWRRQVLFIKDADPAGPHYLLLRDTVKGNQPTMWQMWTVSELVDTPENLRDVPAALAKKPGNQILPARPLPGNRFTALGQFDVDLDYYIANPTDTPRYTLRWGTKYTYTPVYNYTEYHDLLHLQMAGDGAYYVALFPRKRTTPAPTFSTVGGGKIIKVQGAFGTDYGFLALTRTVAEDDGLYFNGTAGSVQDRKGGVELCLGAGGEIRYKGSTLAAEGAAGLRDLPDAAEVNVPASQTACLVTIALPCTLTLAAGQPGVTLKSACESSYALTIPAGVTRVRLVKGK
jgi:hypothetical protein